MDELKMTQAELDALVSARIEEAKKGLFTEDDLRKKVDSEVDRRVESGIQKGLETQREKLEREIREKLTLSAEEIAKKDFEEKSTLLSVKEKELQKRANKIDATDMLSQASIPKSHYDKFLSVLVTDDSDITKANVQNFINMFNETRQDIETKVKSELSHIPPPKGGQGGGAVTIEDFRKMKYAEKVKFRETNPDLYNKYIKS